MKETRDWLSLFAAVGLLSLAVTALLAGRAGRAGRAGTAGVRSPLARPIALLCFVLFGWNFGTVAHHIFGSDAFVAFDSVFTALSPAAVLELVLAFVGKRQKLRTLRLAGWLAFGGLAAVSFAGLFDPRVRLWLDAPSWSALFLAMWLPTVVVELWLLVSHLARATDAQEKARTRTVLAALAIGAAFSSSDVGRGLGLPLPYLGALGMLIAAALLTTLAVRLQLFDRNVRARTALYAVGMIAAFVAVYLVLFRALAESLAAQGFAVAVVTALVVTVVREVVVATSEARARRERLTVLGRFSAQMAHDIRTPMAALLGSVQVLEGMKQGAEDDEQREQRDEFLGIIAEQARRVVAIVDRYDRMGRVEPHKTIVRVDDVVRRVAKLHGVEESALRLAGTNLECEADAQLLESAIENVVRNAIEASEGTAAKGARADVRVETERAASGGVVVRVIDRGEGMDARQRERAFEDFFTTKATGSGLGLAFVRRVLVAHGGEVTLESERGVGTRVELRLPSDA